MFSSILSSYGYSSAPGAGSGPSDTQSSHVLYMNFLVFTVCFSISHATVDAVLAFATAQLGNLIGSYAGFLLYIFYTLSAVLVAKTCLRMAGPKSTVLYGLRCMLVYVASFLIAVLFPNVKWIFYIGAVIGGVGAGTFSKFEF